MYSQSFQKKQKKQKKPRLCKQGKNDVIFTPDELALAIVQHFQPSGRLLEPCRGQGAFCRAFERSGLKNYDICEITEGIDFLKYDQQCDWIITNPPFSKISAFLEKAYKLNPQHIVFLMSASAIWMNGKLATMRKYGYHIAGIFEVESPYFRKLNDWPQSGFVLSTIHITKGNATGTIVHDRIQW